ncbi:MAG TPA: cyclic pyranopterin monophosphate synthase MoaC [Candidatus Nitrosotenuis sp.]|nr:cyclic pyranopterin monophosphate synthase MoaC [Candidatus Nitrosotenuis sp.]
MRPDPELTHLDERGQARMVEVGAKAESERLARARATVRMSPATLERVLAGQVPKGDALAVARIAGIMAAKRTWELIPLCHPLALTGVEVDLRASGPGTVEIEACVRCRGPTGVEMEALTAVSVAALALYDMLKALEKGIEIGPVRLMEKRGGRSGTWTAPGQA